MKPNKKEISLLKDLISSEELCVEKYRRYSQKAADKQLKKLFSAIEEEERVHGESLNSLLSGKIPSTGSGEEQKPYETMDFTSNYGEDEMKAKQDDAYLLSDALSTEKHISASYNTDIFEFVSGETRDVLNHIQKEEQAHGKALYDYMSANNMY